MIEESETLMPVLHNRDEEVALQHILEILKQVDDTQYDVVIFDRLHLTPIAITESSIEKFNEVERILVEKNATLVFLQIEEKDIERRIFESIKHRGPSWGEYVHKKGNRKQILAHYSKAQDKLLKLIKETNLPKIIFDTRDENFDRIAQEIARKCL